MISWEQDKVKKKCIDWPSLEKNDLKIFKGVCCIKNDKTVLMNDEDVKKEGKSILSNY